ncbi:hypothetical protein HAX54_045714, partial [Datura stramonium]|nr:hypothetical protein [Datura stramonium]
YILLYFKEEAENGSNNEKYWILIFRWLIVEGLQSCVYLDKLEEYAKALANYLLMGDVFFQQLISETVLSLNSIQSTEPMSVCFELVYL